MLQSFVGLATMKLDTAEHFLRHLGEAPWQIVAGGRRRTFSAKTFPKMRDWIAKTQTQQLGTFAMPPDTGGHLWHLAVRAPLHASPAKLSLPPSMIVVADEHFLLWRLNEPVKPAEAKRLSEGLAAQIGGEAFIGKPVPLPGTVVFKKTGARMVGRFPVRMLPPIRTAYRIVDQHLRDGRAAPAPEKLDPNLMSVPISEGVTWQPGAQSNGFMLVLGASGSGKTETLKTIGTSIGRYGTPVLVLDFHGDVILPGVPDTPLSSAPDAKIGLNPLEVDIGHARENGLYDQRTAILEMVKSAVPALGHKQQNGLYEALEKAYADAGIHDDAPESWTRPSPTLAQLMDDIEDAGLLAAIRGLFGHPIFRKDQHIPIETLLKASMRLDLSKLPDGVRYMTAETLLRRIFTALRMRGPIPVTPASDKERFRLFIIIDEARLITLGGSSDIVTALVNEARKFGLGMILASQAASHFPHEIRNNAASWLVLKPQTVTEAKQNAPNIGVEPEQLMKLNGRGDGYLRIGNKPACRVQVQPIRVSKSRPRSRQPT